MTTPDPRTGWHNQRAALCYRCGDPFILDDGALHSWCPACEKKAAEANRIPDSAEGIWQAVCPECFLPDHLHQQSEAVLVESFTATSDGENIAETAHELDVRAHVGWHVAACSACPWVGAREALAWRPLHTPAFP